MRPHSAVRRLPKARRRGHRARSPFITDQSSTCALDQPPFLGSAHRRQWTATACIFGCFGRARALQMGLLALGTERWEDRTMNGNTAGIIDASWCWTTLEIARSGMRRGAMLALVLVTLLGSSLAGAAPSGHVTDE